MLICGCWRLQHHSAHEDRNSVNLNEEQRVKLGRAEKIIQHDFNDKQLILSAITHPSATEGRAVKYSYERLEFLGDSVLGAIVASVAFHRYHDLDEGGLTRIKVALVSGTSLSDVANDLGSLILSCSAHLRLAQVVVACIRPLRTFTKQLSQPFILMAVSIAHVNSSTARSFPR